MKRKPDEIAAIEMHPGDPVEIRTITVRERLLSDSSYAIGLLEEAIEARAIDLRYHGMSTTPLYEFEEEWLDGLRDDSHKLGPKPERRRQAVTALLLRDWLGFEWSAIITHFGVREVEKQSLENRVSELRKALHKYGIEIELGVDAPRGKQNNRSLH